ncbi:MAG: hypothetical protein WBO10_04425 [Pyrinomonadaceae bacterium]
MKLTGIIVGVVGAIMFVWHLFKVFTGMEEQTSFFTHHILSLVGGILAFVGIWLWIKGHRRQKG